MAVVIFLLCVAGGLGIFWTCVRPFTRSLADDIRTSRKYLPGVYPSKENRR